MSEQPVDEELERQYAEAAKLGRQHALLMLDAVKGTHASPTVMLNALGNIIESVFLELPLCDQQTLEEYDAWCAYTRSRIVAEQHGEGVTRQ